MGRQPQPGSTRFLTTRSFFRYIELGATTAQDRLYLDNVHATFWHTDARQQAGTPEGWGVALSAQKFLNDQWLPFVRFGYAEGDAALMQTTLSAGIGWYRNQRDVAGLGLSWGAPADGALDDQFTSELFYRCQLTEFLAITPDVQLVVDPALHPQADVIAWFGVRLRLAF